MPSKEIEKHLSSHGVKLTAMRLLVFEELERARRPLSLHELEERMPTAERSTIFRTLSLLLSHHLVHPIEDGSGSLRYEVCQSPDHHEFDDQHTHFYCERCQRTFCLRDSKVPSVSLPEGFVALTTNYMIKGICPSCAASQH